MSRPGGKLWAGSDEDSSASESEAAVDIGAEQKRQQKRWEIDSDSGACVKWDVKCVGGVCTRKATSPFPPLIRTATTGNELIVNYKSMRLIVWNLII